MNDINDDPTLKRILIALTIGGAALIIIPLLIDTCT